MVTMAINLNNMVKLSQILSVILLLVGCDRADEQLPTPYDNPEVSLNIPVGFPEFNSSVKNNKPTKYGVKLGERLFNEKKFSGNNTISCKSCHNQAYAFTDKKAKAVGIFNRVGLRNTPAIQNMAFMKFYNWDGNILELENQPLVPIITHEEMNSSIVEVIGKLKLDQEYSELFFKALPSMHIP